MTELDLLDTPQACEYLGAISRATLYREWKRGKLRPTKVGGSTRWRRSELDRYLRANERTSAA